MNTEAKVPTENSNKQDEQASSICSRMQGWFNNQVTNVNHYVILCKKYMIISTETKQASDKF